MFTGQIVNSTVHTNIDSAIMDLVDDIFIVS